MIPVRSFRQGKSRLRGALGEAEHVAFVRELADRAADAAAAYRTVVVTSALEVIEWATQRGLPVVADRGSLDFAAADGRTWAGAQGATRVVIVHADLPDITSLDAVAGDGAAPVAVIVACHRGDGTPVLSIPVAAPFEFAYGAGSFERHRAAAHRAGLGIRVVADHGLSFDVDGPDDLDIVRACRARVTGDR